MTACQKYVAEDCVCVLRGTILLFFGLILYNREAAQGTIDDLYKILLTSRLFNSVYFETIWATVSYTIIILAFPILATKFTYFDAFKLSPNSTYKGLSTYEKTKEAFYYMAPLMFLDTIFVKKYCGVEPEIWNQKRKYWIQTTRALPVEPPYLFQIFYELVLSLLLFDILFFILHFAMHKNYFLYKYIHRHHHDHEFMHAHVTNQLSVVERVTLVLCANFALKVFNSHPLTRTFFVPIFQFILVDNHSGYDMPFGLHRLVPFGIAGGSVKHFEHHVTGKRAYQPILTYLDKMVQVMGKRETKKMS